MVIIIKIFYFGKIYVNYYYINLFFVDIVLKFLSIFLNYFFFYYENFVIFLIGFFIYLFEVIFLKWWVMLVSKWIRLWTSFCYFMVFRFETRFSKGYWWVRLLRCLVRIIGFINYYVSCFYFRVDFYFYLFLFVILFLNYVERVLIFKMIYFKKNWGLIFFIGMTIWY